MDASGAAMFRESAIELKLFGGLQNPDRDERSIPAVGTGYATFADDHTGFSFEQHSVKSTS
jgi:hypothetical protein